MRMLTRLLLVLFGSLLSSSHALAVTYVVNSTNDTGDIADGNGLCSTGSIILINGTPATECTLRAALEDADARRGPDTIVFHPNLATSGGFARFTPGSAYPILSDPLTIDGTTAPGYATADPNAVPVIQIDGSIAGGANGLFLGFGSSNSTILALALFGFVIDGIRIDQADGVTIQGCHLGVDSGFLFSGNGSHGLDLSGDADDNVIGQDCGPTLGCPGRGNVISANQLDGIRILSGDGNRIAGNMIGTNVTGTSLGGAVNFTGNQFWGVEIVRGSDNDIGDVGTLLVAPPGSPTEVAAGNVISGNGFAGEPGITPMGGVGIEGTVAACDPPGGDPGLCSNNRIRANRIGTDLMGTLELGNESDGIDIFQSDHNVIGGSGQAGNLLSGNGGAGIRLSSNTGTQIIGNTIGLNANHTAALPNNTNELVIPSVSRAAIQATGSEILIDGNVVAGNQVEGIRLEAFGTAPSNVINNLVGTNENGDDFGNGHRGILAQREMAHVGLPFQGNVVGFNGAGGIVAFGGARVRANFVGTNPDGENLGNTGSGIEVLSEVHVGGSLAGEGNVIAFNEGYGVLLDADGDAGSMSILEGNRIGILPDGTPAGNLGPGVRINWNGTFDTNDPVIVGGPPNVDLAGLPQSGNWIAYNQGPGITVPDASEITVRGNSIHDNGGTEIDLDDDGPTPNDIGDADTGANELQNSPELHATTQYDAGTGDLTVVYRMLSSPLSSQYPIWVDFYLDYTGGEPEGRVYVGSDLYTTELAGLYKTIELTPPAGVVVAGWLTATATDEQQPQGNGVAGGNTSEFGPSVPVPEAETSFGWLIAGVFLASRARRRTAAYPARP